MCRAKTRRPCAIYCGVARMSVPTCSAPNIGCRSFSYVTIDAARRRVPGRSDILHGWRRSGGRARRSSRHSRRTAAGLMKPWRDCAPSTRTCAEHSHLRRVLVEAAWHYRHRPALGYALRTRQQGAPAAAIRCAWTAQHRLHGRYRRLLARGKPPQVAATAVARELSAFCLGRVDAVIGSADSYWRALGGSMR